MSELILSVEKQGSRLELSKQEINEINNLLKNITSQYNLAEDVDFLNKASLYAHQLPKLVHAVGDGFLSLDCTGSAATARVQAFCFITQAVGSGTYLWLAQLVSAFEQRLRTIT